MRRDKLSTKMYYVYILQNAEGKLYIGSSQNLFERLRRHNQNRVRSTKQKGPFTLIYKEEFSTRTEARKQENQIKRYKKISYFLQSVQNLMSPSSSPA